MKALQRAIRGWLRLDAQQADARRTARAIAHLSRQVALLRAQVQDQRESARDAASAGGAATLADEVGQSALQRALRALEGDGDVLAGPWTGEVGFELLYWIPFLNWLVAQGLDPRRLIVVSRGGAAPWYRHLTSRYVDILDLITPDELRERTSEGKRKQYSAKQGLDRDLLKSVRDRHDLWRATLVHPSAMFRLFAPVWRQRATIDLVQSFTSFRHLTPAPPVDSDGARADLPAKYVTAKFYFSRAFPDTVENREFISALLRRVSAQIPVVLLSTTVQIDDHVDYRPSGHSGVYVLDAHGDPRTNLARQTDIVAGGRGFMGTYGGFSYLAPFYGVRSLSFFSRRNGFSTHHLELADRVFDRLLPGGFLAIHRSAADLIDPAIARWMEAPRAAAADAPPAETAGVVQ